MSTLAVGTNVDPAH